MKDDRQDRQKQLRTVSAISMVMTLFVIATTIVIITGVDGGIWVAAAFAAIGLAVGGYFGLRGIRAGRSAGG